jgi:hypothetical protein
MLDSLGWIIAGLDPAIHAAPRLSEGLNLSKGGSYWCRGVDSKL